MPNTPRPARRPRLTVAALALASGAARPAAAQGPTPSAPVRSAPPVTAPSAAPRAGDTTLAAVLPNQLPTPVRAVETGQVPPPGPTGRINVPVDADMLAVLTALDALQTAPIETLAPLRARQQPSVATAANEVARRRTIEGLGEPSRSGMGVLVRDTVIPGPGGALPVRVYTPEGAAGPLPVVVYFHGGGWVIADRNVYDGGARGLAKSANAVVVSVEYRRAPEFRFPAAHDDALAAYRWVSQNARRVGGDPARLALAGESAGGNLAVATAVAARDARLPAPRHVVSVYPVAQTDTNTASYQQYAFAKPLDRGMIGWFVAYTVRTPADLQDPRLRLTAANLRGLAPVTIVNAEIDPLRDDGMLLEAALRGAGVSVERRLYPGVTHEFFGLGPVVAKAAQAQQYAGERLKAAFAR